MGAEVVGGWIQEVGEELTQELVEEADWFVYSLAR